MEKTYNQRIKELREDRDLLQKDVAKVLNITSNQYSLYETGQREFKIDHIIKLSILFDVTTDYILLGKK